MRTLNILFGNLQPNLLFTCPQYYRPHMTSFKASPRNLPTSPHGEISSNASIKIQIAITWDSFSLCGMFRIHCWAFWVFQILTLDVNPTTQFTLPLDFGKHSRIASKICSVLQILYKLFGNSL